MSVDDEFRLAPLRQRPALSDEAYESIKEMIMDHAVAPGSQLAIDRLARELRVSQTPVREALARLESDRLVSKATARGYSVAPLLTRTEVFELFDLRSLLEPWAAGRAAESHDRTFVKDLRTELEQFQRQPASKRTTQGRYNFVRVLSSHDARFHDLLFVGAGNETVRAVMERAHSHLHLGRLFVGSSISPATVREHLAILVAVESGSAEAAYEAMRNHLEASRARMVELLDQAPQR